MMINKLKIIFLVFMFTFFEYSNAQNNINDQHIEVSMRLIGHEVLLASGDTVSRVLPIEKIEDRYKISFDTQFEFVPDDLMVIIDDVVNETSLASNYIVEVEDCLSKEVVYSYEIIDADSSSLLPCRQRAQPLSCYNIYFTIISVPNLGKKKTKVTKSEDSNNSRLILLLCIVGCVGVVILLLVRKKQPVKEGNSNLINIGDYKFDQIQMELFYAKDKVELTSKESDLLILLHTSANKVVERDVILQSVWGDEGDYVGRTLDVFISKLRKKLTKDDSVKIVNVRGVGYKLIIGESI